MKDWKYRIGGVCLALLFLLICIVLTNNKSIIPQEKTEYEILMFGDSIFGEIRDHTSIPEVLSTLTKETVFNAGIGGSLASYKNVEFRSDAPQDALSLVELVKAIAYEDFAIVDSEFARNTEVFPYFEEVLKGLKNIDHKTTSVIYIEHGVNDYMTGIPLENEKDYMDPYTYKGALRTAITLLKELSPKAQIILCTPTYMVIYDEFGTYQTCEEMDFGGGTLPEYVEAMKEVAKEFQLQVLDNYYELGVRERTVSLYTVDGLHLSSWAREKMAQNMYQQLKELKKP
jgi:lysophospholipase L1-like esterase